MLTCGEFEERLLAYLNGELPWLQHRIMDFHLATCPECRAYLKAYRTTVALGQTVFEDPDAPLPDSVPDDLVTAILDAFDEEPRK
jgi:anti-sigma factor RsiW